MSEPPATGNELVRIEDLVVEYRLRRGVLSREQTQLRAVDGVSLSVNQGETLGIVGATGSGKSTIAQVIMGMVEPTSGSVTILGRSVEDAVRPGSSGEPGRVQVVLQDPYSSLDPRMNVGDIIAEPLTLGRTSRRAGGRAVAERRVAELLDLVGLPANRATRFPHQFSGGQRQRIAIARALATQPDLIILDEPTSALDVSIRAQILNLLRRLQRELGVTYVVISHDLVTVAYLSSRIAVMHLGRIVELGPTPVMYTSPGHPYTGELLASVPGRSRRTAPHWSLAVAPATLPATACRYAYRCPLRVQLGNPARCVEEDPALLPVSDGHQAACHFHADVQPPPMLPPAESGPLARRPVTPPAVTEPQAEALPGVGERTTGP